MAESLPRHTPRQIADAIVCAVMDADHDAGPPWKTKDAERRLVMSSAVLETLKHMGVAFVDDPSGDYWGVS